MAREVTLCRQGIVDFLTELEKMHRFAPAISDIVEGPDVEEEVAAQVWTLKDDEDESLWNLLPGWGVKDTIGEQAKRSCGLAEIPSMAKADEWARWNAASNRAAEEWFSHPTEGETRKRDAIYHRRQKNGRQSPRAFYIKALATLIDTVTEYIPKDEYTVTLKRTITQEGSVTVTAGSEEEAQRLAEEEDIDWEETDSEIEITDCTTND